MVKAMFFLYRRADLSDEAFRGYSQDVHVLLVSRVPGLRRYIVNHTMHNPSDAANACDAVAELWFDSIEAFQTALTSPEGVAALRDQANYLDLARTHVLFVNELHAL